MKVIQIELPAIGSLWRINIQKTKKMQKLERNHYFYRISEYRSLL